MTLSPKERLKRLEQLLAEKEKRKKELEQEEKRTDKELSEAKRELAREIAELRRDEEVLEMAERVGRLEERGLSDEEIQRQLSDEGLDARFIGSVMRLHNHIHHPEEERGWSGNDKSLEAIAEEAPAKQEEGHVLYRLAAVEQGLYSGGPSLENRSGYEALRRFEHEIRARGGEMTPNEYDALKTIEDTIQGSDQHYHQRERQVIRDIKGMVGLRISSPYTQTDWQDY